MADLFPMEVDRWISKIRKIADHDRIETAKERMKAAWNFKPLDRPPISILVPPPKPWPSFEYSETFHNLDKMLLSQLSYALFPSSIGG